MTSKSNISTGRLAVLDVVVLIAMAVTAAAFSAGLIVNSGIDMMAGVIAGAALFMVMASSHYVITRSARSATVGGRLDELEEALIVLDGDLQRIDQVEDDVARLDLLNDRVERLDQFVSDYDGGADGGTRMVEIERLTQDLEQLRTRFDTLRSEFQTETQAQRDEIGAELRSLEDLIKELSHDFLAASSGFATAVSEEESSEIPLRLEVAEEEDRGEIRPSEPEADMVTVVEVVETSDLAPALETAGEDQDEGAPGELSAETVTVVEVEVDDEEEDAVALAAEPAASGGEMLQALRQAIETNRIDLFLQPIVTLPERKIRYFDALTRIRTDEGDFIQPGSHQGVAEREGLMPRIDNVMLVKCVQLLRRLGPESRLKGVFCNLSIQSLLDADFFPELVEFLEENSTLGDSLTFRMSQLSIQDLGAIELASLRTLGKVGFGFLLDRVNNLDLDFAALRDHFFRFIKIEAKTFLYGLETAGAPVPAADMTSHLDRFDLKLIVDKVEDEQSLERLVEYGIELGQGDLFAAPSPVTPETFSDLEGADAG